MRWSFLVLLASVAWGGLWGQRSAAAVWPRIAQVKEIGGGARDAAIIVAAERYLFVPHVEGAARNGVAWFQYFANARGVPLERIAFLRNAQASVERIRKQAQRVASLVEPGGTLWFVFIGHGAAAKDGKDGVLVGVDAQQNADSLYARSLPRSELLALLKQTKAEQVVAVLDACFSGRTSQGAPLVPGIQPLIVTQEPAPTAPPVTSVATPAATPATTPPVAPAPTPPSATSAPVVAPATGPRILLFTAAAGDEFAGALPGEHRPAYSYLTLGALRGWADSDGDGDVSAQEVHRYTQRALGALVTDRSQTPSFEGIARTKLARGWEKGPDLAAMVVGIGEGAHAKPAPAAAPPAPTAPTTAATAAPAPSAPIAVPREPPRATQAPQPEASPPAPTAALPPHAAPAQPMTAPTLTGTWLGHFASNLVPAAQSQFTMEQHGQVVTGTFVTSGGTSGTIVGLARGPQVALELRATTPACPGVFQLQGLLVGRVLAFEFVGADCMGTHLGGRGRAKRR